VETVAGPATPTAIDLSVTFDLSAGVISTASATVIVGQCLPPPLAPVSLTFTKTHDRATALVGETVTYTYAGTNTSSVALEVVELVDDRLCVILFNPAVQTVVQPGESISRQVTYVVTANDICTISNRAVVTVGRVDSTDHGAGEAAAVVQVPEPPVPPDPPQPTLPTTTPATAAPRGTLPATGGGGDAELLVVAVIALLARATTASVARRRHRSVR